MPSLEIYREESRKIYQILDDQIVVGTDPSCAICVDADRVAARHARFVSDASGDVVVESLGPALRVNGEVRRRRELAHGDVVHIGSVALVFLADGEPAPIVPKRVLFPPEPDNEPEPADASSLVVAPIRSVPKAPPKRLRPSEPSERSSRVRATRGTGVPNWMIATLALLGGIAVITISIRVLGATSQRDADDLLNLAEHKLKLNQVAMAEAYLEQAEQGNPDAAERARIREIRATIQRVVRAKQDARALAAANTAYSGRIMRFKVTYLDGKPERREAAREFLRMLDAWMRDHREVCERSRDGQSMIEEVERMRSRYAGAARMNESDTADDALFRAGRRTRRKDRSNFREAVAILDGWLAANPDSKDVDRVRRQRDDWTRESKQWFEKQTLAIEALARRGYPEDAVERMRFIAEDASLPEWADAAHQKLAELRALTR